MLNINTESELRTSLSSRGRIKPIYLLVGDDPYLVKNYAQKIAKITVGDNADLNLVALPENAEVQDIYDNIMQASFTGDSICVLASNYPFETCSATEFKKLISVIENAPTNNVLVLYYDVIKVDVKKAKNFKALTGAVEKAGGIVCALNHKTESELVKILCDGAAKRFVRLETAAAKYMVSVCSNDLNILINELDKLCAYVGSEGVITTETVDIICPKTLEASVFDLTKLILSGNAQKAFLLLNDLLAKGNSPAQIYSLISDCYVDIYRAKSAIKEGVRPNSIAEKFGYGRRAFVLDNAVPYARRLTDKQLSLILNEILSVNTKVKNDSKITLDGAKTSLETLVVKILKISSGEYNA